MVLRHTENNKPINNCKGLDKAVKHFEAGDISNIEYSIIDDSLMYVKAICIASMKKARNSVFVCICDREDISYAYCQCPIGLAQTCSHIGALLFALNAFGRSATGQSCTSKQCLWNVPRALKIKAIPLSAWNLSKPKVNDSDGVDLKCDQVKQTLDFDPRHPSQRDFDVTQSLAHLKELKRVFPNTVPMTTSINEELSMFIEKRTRGQRKNPLWHQLHRGRLTSSLFSTIMHAGEKPYSLINQILQGSNLDKYPKLPKAVQWGIDHEDQAKLEYIRLQSAVADVRIEESGLTLHPSYTFLGASSDGWVIDNSKPEEVKWGCLEVKCPFSINGNLVIDTPVEQLVQYKEFCLEETEDGARHLKQHHPYYAQVQERWPLRMSHGVTLFCGRMPLRQTASLRESNLIQILFQK